MSVNIFLLVKSPKSPDASQRLFRLFRPFPPFFTLMLFDVSTGGPTDPIFFWLCQIPISTFRFQIGLSKESKKSSQSQFHVGLSDELTGHGGPGSWPRITRTNPAKASNPWISTTPPPKTQKKGWKKSEAVERVTHLLNFMDQCLNLSWGLRIFTINVNYCI